MRLWALPALEIDMKKVINLAFILFLFCASEMAVASDSMTGADYNYNNTGPIISTFMKYNHILSNDIYLLGFIGKITTVHTKPLLVYMQLKDKKAGIYKADPAFEGNFGKPAFRAQLSMVNISWDANKFPLKSNYTTIYDDYMNLWHSSEQAELATISSYDSSDKTDDMRQGGANGFGDKSKTTGALLLGDRITFYDDDNTHMTGSDPLSSDIRPKVGKDSLTESRLFSLHRKYDISEKLNIGGFVGYAECFIDIPEDKWNGATAWELSFNATYKFTSNIIYDLGAGLAQLKWGDDTPNPDKDYKLFHRFTVEF